VHRDSARRTAAAICMAAAVVSCSDSSGPPAVDSVTVSAAVQSIVAGDSLQLTAVARDAAGNVLPDRPATWSSNQQATAAVHASTGMFRALQPGPVVITAQVEAKAGSITLTVLPVPVASVTLEGDTLLETGQARQYSALPRDAAGNVLEGRPIAWSSSDTLVLRVTAGGQATAMAPGRATLTATSEERSGTLGVTVFVPGVVPVITGVTPAALAPGMTAVITGSGFAATPALNTVTFGGVPATVTTATAGELRVAVPCTGSGSVAVEVVTGGRRSNAVTRPLTVNRLELAPGQAHVFATAESSHCNELPVGGDVRYLVTVFSSSITVNSLTDFQLAGNAPLAAAEPVIAAARPRAVQPLRDTHTAHDSAHAVWLERERQLHQELRTRARTQVVHADVIAAQQRPVPEPGDMRTLFWNFNGCNNASTTFRARAVHVGSRAVIWEDSANVMVAENSPSLNGYYRRLGTIFDQEQYAVVRDHFGDPLLRDAETDNDGRIHMVFTQRLNGTGAAAYVTFCDQYPPPNAPASNFGEYFYGIVPITEGSHLNSTSFPDGWFNFMARTVVHEVKHIASQAARVVAGASGEQSWLEEGTARHAEEIWVRKHLHDVPWKANTGFGSAATNGIYCDFVSDNAACLAADPLRRPSLGMRRHFNEILPRLVEPWAWSPYGTGTGQTGSVFYQTAWSLVRYVIDRWGTSDAAFLTALNSSSLTGLNNLSTVAGVTPVQMIGLWGLALYADDFPGLAAPHADLQFPTWNTRDIYAGLHLEPSWTHRFTAPFMLQPVQLPFGPFVTQRTGLRAGAHAYYELAGSTAVPQLLRLQAIGGGAAPPNLHIAVARLR
jgi:hypothetical protein